MGYDVHITRAADWSENDEAPILLNEWLAYVDADPEMELEDFAEALTSEGPLRYQNAGLAVWTAYSGDGRDGNRAWFDFRDGDVAVKNPDEEILDKMCRIAQALGARVQGDDGEFYPTALEPDAPSARSAHDATPPWWRRLFRRE